MSDASDRKISESCSGSLTKLELAQRLSEEMGFSVRASKKLVTSLFECMKEELAAGNKVKIVRFGTFRPVCKKARKGINPHTGQAIEIPARRSVAFKPSSLLKKRVNAAKGQEILQDRRGEPDSGD